MQHDAYLIYYFLHDDKYLNNFINGLQEVSIQFIDSVES